MDASFSARRALWGLAVLAAVLALVSWARRPADASADDALLQEVHVLLVRHKLATPALPVKDLRRVAKGTDPALLSRAFHAEVDRASAKALRWLVNAGARPQGLAPPEQQQMLFRVARQSGPETLELLLSLGFVLQTTDSDGRTVLHQASASNASAAAIAFIVKRGLPVNTPSTIGATALHETLGASVVPLLAAGADLEARDSAGRTPLLSATQHHRTTAVAALLQAGASVHAANVRGQTALHMAYAARSRALIDLLEQAGAPRTARDIDGRQPAEMSDIRP